MFLLLDVDDLEQVLLLDFEDVDFLDFGLLAHHVLQLSQVARVAMHRWQIGRHLLE